MPGPIIINDINNKKFKKLINIIIEELNARCLKENTKSIKINFSDLIDYDTNSQKFFILLENLIKNKFINKSFLALRINLKNNIEEVYKQISKGHKSEIKKQINKKYYFKDCDDELLSFDNFKDLINDHIDLDQYSSPLYEIYKKKKIIIAYEAENNLFVGIHALINSTAEYLLDNFRSNNHHSFIFESIKFFKNNKKLDYLNLGNIGNLYNIDLNFSKKKENIATFKKGFGGEKYLLSIFEKRYF